MESLHIGHGARIFFERLDINAVVCGGGKENRASRCVMLRTFLLARVEATSKL